MPKVLVVATSPESRGGIATVVNAISKTSVWETYKCCWIETHVDKTIIHKIVKLISSLMRFFILLPWYDIVHIHLSTTVSANRKYIFYKLAHLYRKRIVVHLHCGSQLSHIWNYKYEEMCTNADKCIVLSNSIRDLVASKTGSEDNIAVVYNPSPSNINVDIPSIQKRDKIILFAATLYREKGYLDLIEAFAQIACKYPEWQLVLAGNGSQDEGINKSVSLGVAKRVKFLGWIKGVDKDRVFRSASIFCLPSYAEGFPMAVLDAWAYGIPVVTTPVGGIPDIVFDGKNGLLFKPGDVNELAQKLSILIDNQDLSAKISLESMNLAQTTFNCTTIANQIAGIYDEILN